MHIFISWSGLQSHRVALALREWLPNVIQAVDPYVSSEDVSKGSRWSREVGEHLADADFGIVCVTRENLHSPWLNFEAGALANRLADARVCTLLFQMQPSDVTGPLAQFQHTKPDEKADVLLLLKSINQKMAHPLDEMVVARAVGTWWNDFSTALTDASGRPPTGQEIRSERQLLNELVEAAREIQRRLPPPREMANVADFYGELNRAVRQATSTLDLTHIRATPPRDFGEEADPYFRGLLEWVQVRGRSIRRIICIPNEPMLEWAMQLAEETRNLPQFSVRVVKWDLSSPSMGMAIVDGKKTFLALTGATIERTRGLSVDDSTATQYFLDYYDNFWREGVDLEDWLSLRSG